MANTQYPTQGNCATTVPKILTYDANDTVATLTEPLKKVTFIRTTEKTRISVSKTTTRLTSVVQTETLR